MYEFFAWFGSISLLMLSYQDFKNNRKIDDRRNFFMFGVAAVIPSLLGLNFWLVLLHIIVIFILRAVVIKLFSKYHGALGSGDVSSLFWVIMGFAWLGWYYMGLFFLSLFSFTLIYFAIKKLMRIKEATPFMIVIFCAFVLTCGLLGLY